MASSKKGIKQDSAGIEQRLRLRVIGSVVLGAGIGFGLFGFILGFLLGIGAGEGIELSKTLALITGSFGASLFVTGSLMMEIAG